MKDPIDVEAEAIVKSTPQSEWPAWVRNRYMSWRHNPPVGDQGTKSFPPEWMAPTDLYFQGKWTMKDAGWFRRKPDTTVDQEPTPPYEPPSIPIDQSYKPEEYRTPFEEPVHTGPLPYTNEWDGSTAMRYSWHPEHGLSVWPAEAGYHSDWMAEHNIPDTLEGDSSYAGGIITPKRIEEYHALDPKVYAGGVNAVQSWIAGQGLPVPPASGQIRQARWKLAGGESIPANYSPADPYDIQGKMPLINAMKVDWWDMPPEQAKQVIINAFRATMLSPRMNLKSNAILYQSLMDIPAEESDPNVFENRVRDLKAKWDTQGQSELGQDPDDIIDPNTILPGKFMPGFWGNIRRLANLGPFANQIYQAAMDDIDHGGTGEIFRNKILELGVPGVQAKVASFAWLALAPTTSELATIDVHMMRHLNQDADSPRDTKQYLQLEDQLRNERDQTYGTEVPLAHYQWGVWDARRTPGFHQDHTPLRAYQPTPFRDVAWPATFRPPRPQAPIETDPNQLNLLGKWTSVGLPRWQMIRLAQAYSLQGKIVGGVADLEAQGIAVRPDRQSKDEIESIIAELQTHQQDALKQKELIPDWALNRGGKTAADFAPGPGGVGTTYAQSVICVAEWVDTNHNWLLLSPACTGIVAEKGGAASHGVVVARERNIAIVVDVPGAAQITPGDVVHIDSGNAIINVNGGGTEQFGEAEQAEVPLYRFIWSQGKGETAPVPQDDPESGVLHQNLIVQAMRAGEWDRQDNAAGVIYPDGHVQMIGHPSDQEQMTQWLNTIHPITNIEEGFSF